MEHNLHLSQHISKRFNTELDSVRNQVLQMGGIIEKQVENGLDALLNADLSLAKKVVENDSLVNDLEMKIDKKSTQILAMRQPAASDLRMMVTIIKMITDLERIGDEAAKLGKNTLELSDDGESARQFIELRHLGEHVKKTLNKALTAYARLDVESALEIIRDDKTIDQEFDSISRLLITRMMEDPREIKNSLRITWCARSLARIGNHTTNICEFIVYLVEGKDVRHLSNEEIKKELN